VLFEGLMSVKETLKKTFENLTGVGREDVEVARGRVEPVEPEAYSFADDGTTPNNPALPFLVYPGAVRLAEAADPAAVFEVLFESHGWGGSWRNGIFDFLHYHSQIHEALGIARGRARVRFGGDKGRTVAVEAGDVAILPAGTGHQLIEGSNDLLVVGAYPPEGRYDLCRGRPEEHARAVRSIPEVPVPLADPVFGKDGGLTRFWRP
jgi:uncharacterized protein YjlB